MPAQLFSGAVGTVETVATIRQEYFVSESKADEKNGQILHFHGISRNVKEQPEFLN
jgi:hypothetical protein